MNLRSGTRLGPYEIVAPIGVGGMGEVYRARDTRLGRSVAVKILTSEFAGETKLKVRFEREAKLISSLNHPHICILHDIGRENDLDYLVMELCDGKTLAQRLRDGPLPSAQVLEYGVQIADALEKAHQKGIIHRDLKPSNVMVTKGGVKILDFGLAKQQETVERAAGSYTTTLNKPLTGETGIAGTLQYMAPETLTSGHVDARSDIYSLGLVLYEMISGRAAFRAESRAELVAAILEHDPPSLTAQDAAVDPLLAHIVSRCLEKDPDQRWQSAGDIAAQLQWLRARPETTIRETRKPGLLLWATMAVLLVVLAAVTITFIRTRAAKPISYDRLTFRRGMITQARFAPDGQTVIFGATWDGDPVRIFVKRPEADDIVPLDLPPADLLSVSRSGELAILVDPRRELPWSRVGTLARVSLGGGSPRRLVDGVISADWSPDGSSLALIRDDGRDQRLEIRSSDGELVRQLYATSSGGLSNVRFSPSGDRIAFAFHPDRSRTTRSTVMVMNTDGLNPRSMGSTTVFTAVTWSPDGREVWFDDAAGVLLQTTIRAMSMSGRARTILSSPGSTSFHDIAGGKILMTQSDIGARVSCVARGSSEERDTSWGSWTLPLDMTEDGRQILLLSSSPIPYRVGLKPLDGSPITNLTSGTPLSFSADERSVLVAPNPKDRPTELAFVPIDSGGKVSLTPTNLDAISSAVAAPNGKTVIVTGVAKNVMRLYEKPIAGGELRRISDERLYFPFIAVSSDSSAVAAVGPTRRVTVYSIATGKASVIPTSVPGDLPIRFADDGSVYYSRYLRLPSVIYRYNFRTQRESVIREITPADRAGVLYAYPRVMTADAQCYCYQYTQVLSKLYLTEGIDRHARGFW